MSSESILVTFEDTDPIITYRPSVDSSSGGTWRTTYPSNIFHSTIGPSGSQEGEGNSLRITSTTMATLEFGFFGTSLELLGTGGQSQYTVSIDGKDSELMTESGGILASFSDLPLGQHRCILTVNNPDPELAFDRAIFTSGLTGTWSNLQVGHLSAEWVASEGWKSQLNRHPSGNEQTVAVTSKAGATSWLTFSGVSITLTGNTVSDHGRYRISLEPGFDSQIFNGASLYLVQRRKLFYQGGLDPAVSYNLTIENVDGLYLDYEYATVVQPASGGSSGTIAPIISPDASGFSDSNSAASSSKPSSALSSSTVDIGAVIGGVLGGGALVLGSLALFLVMRRRRRRMGKRDANGMNNSAPTIGSPRHFDILSASTRTDSHIRPYIVTPSGHISTGPEVGDDPVRTAETAVFVEAQTLASPLAGSNSALRSQTVWNRASMMSHGTQLPAYSQS